MVHYKVKLIEEKKKKPEKIEKPDASADNAIAISKWPKYLKYLLLIVPVIILFISGMLFQMYRETQPETRGSDTDIKEKINAIVELRDRETFKGTYKSFANDELVLLSSSGTELIIYIPENIIIFGGQGKPVKLREIEKNTELSVTAKRLADDTLEAVRIMIYDNSD